MRHLKPAWVPGRIQFILPIASAFIAGCLNDSVPPPSVTGLAAQADSSGVIHLSWNKSTSKRVQAYLIYRDSLGVVPSSETPYKSTTGTRYDDTIYTTELPTPEGRYHHLDTVVHAFTYRIRILDSSDNIGTLHSSAQGVPIPPSRGKYVSGRWHKALAESPFGRRLGPNVVVFNNALWLFGGVGDGVPNNNPNRVWTDVWKSTDGIQWQKVADSLPYARYTSESEDNGVKAAVHDSQLWIVPIVNEPGKVGRSIAMHSSDGISWSVAKDPLPHAPSTVFAFKGDLYTYWSTWNAMPNDFYRSPNGTTWSLLTQSSPLPSTTFGGPSGPTFVAEFNDKVWVVGGGGANKIYGHDVFQSSNVSAWTSVYSHFGDFLPRVGHALVAHGGKLWTIGGRHEPTGRELPDQDYPDPTLQSQVWNSTDGTAWNLVDLNPFPVRDQPAAVSFNGRLLVIGGIQADGTNDIWYYE